MAQYLSDIVEEKAITCNVCRKDFIVEELTLDDWNFAHDGYVINDCCSDCGNDNLIEEITQ
tara:strand:- start:1163 stop:1345 length:183 start_codon:yes stop_codon:yes gene_type:complete